MAQKRRGHRPSVNSMQVARSRHTIAAPNREASRIRVCIVGASLNTGNLGVSAIVSGTIAAILNAHSAASVTILDYGLTPELYELPHSAGVIVVQFVNVRFSRRLHLKNNIVRLLWEALRSHVLCRTRSAGLAGTRNAYLRDMACAHVVLAISGGDSFSEIYGFRRLLYVSLPQLLALLLGKPLVLLPQTIGPFKTFYGTALARLILKRARAVFTREPRAVPLVRALVGRKQVRVAFSHDMAFALEGHICEDRVPPWLERRDRTLPLIGLNISGLLYIGGYSGSNMFRLKCDYRELMLDLVSHLVSEYEACIMLVPHVLTAGESGESDLAASRRLCSQANSLVRNHLYLLDSDYDHYETKALIGRCDYFVGARMHACIAALSQGVPATGLAYSSKFSGVYDSIGMRQLAVDLRRHDAFTVIRLVSEHFRQRQVTREQLRSQSAVARDSVSDVFRVLAQELGL